MFHIYCISTHKFLYLISFWLPFAWYFCPLVLPQLSALMFSFFVFNYYVLPICCNFCVCVYPLIPQHCHIFMFTHMFGGVCVCVLPYVLFICAFDA
jgi:hypothetical protein